MFIKMRVGIEIIVRADNGCVSPGIPAAEVAFFEHCDIGYAVLPREVISGGQAVPTAADNDNIVFLLWRRAAPGERPLLVIAEGVADQGDDRIFHGGAGCMPGRESSAIKSASDIVVNAEEGGMTGELAHPPYSISSANVAILWIEQEPEN